MVSRRKQTSMPEEQPVRFYKIIAITFLCLTLLLFGAVIFMSSQKAVITIETKATPIEINNDLLVGDGVADQSITAIVTTTSFLVRQPMAVSGTTEVPGIATGKVTLHNDTAAGQPLVATTRLLTEDGVLFRIKSAVNIPAQGTVEAEVYADKEGVTGDIGASKFTIPGLPEAKQKVVYATSDEAMSGGIQKSGVLSQADIDAAEKQMTDALDSEVAKYLGNLYAGKEVIYSVISIDKKINGKVGESISNGVLDGKVKIALVVYDKAELKDWAEKTIQAKAVGDTSIIRSSGEEPKVTFKSYNPDLNTATLHVFSAGVASMNPASKELEKNIFFGKTRDEVKRYVSSLEHVENVNISLQPFWIQSVPQIQDHIQVIVKEVQ
jgi:hypothetical protein